VRLLLDEMFPPSIAVSLRRKGLDVVAIQERPSLRGLPDPQVFVAAQLEQRCLVTENVSDFVRVEAAWRCEQAEPHHGLILVAPGAFPRHRPRTVGMLIEGLARLAEAGRPGPGLVAWLDQS
jgi:predicted nuclease of predicted toxin-antitoxin system